MLEVGVLVTSTQGLCMQQKLSTVRKNMVYYGTECMYVNCISLDVTDERLSSSLTC